MTGRIVADQDHGEAGLFAFRGERSGALRNIGA
jgi:hypothetical protein